MTQRLPPNDPASSLRPGVASGLYHGVNPGMGWPLAVSAGLMERSSRAPPLGETARRKHGGGDLLLDLVYLGGNTPVADDGVVDRVEPI